MLGGVLCGLKERQQELELWLVGIFTCGAVTPRSATSDETRESAYGLGCGAGPSRADICLYEFLTNSAS